MILTILPFSSVYFRYGTDTNLTAIEDVSCDYSSYLVLLQCSVSSHYSSLCSEDSYDLVVDCCEFNCKREYVVIHSL